MGEVLSGVNGSIIKWARQRYNLDAGTVALSLGISEERYNAWEEGRDYPTYAKLKALSKILKRPSIAFFLPEPPSISEMKSDLRTLSSKVVNSLNKNVIIMLEKAKVYQLNLKELYGEKESFFSNIETDLNNIEMLASEIREFLNFPLRSQKQRNNAVVVFRHFREKLYENGIYVFKDSFKDNSVSGLCLYEKQYPIIMINNKMSFKRQLFTLFHELYHILSKRNGVGIIDDDYYKDLNENQKIKEKKCDEFANEFLIPSNDFSEEINGLIIDEIAIEKLANLYSVSKEAIMYKLYALDRIKPEMYNELKDGFYRDIVRIDQKSKGGNVYYNRITYLGEKYITEVFSQYFSNRIDIYKASEYLNTKTDHLPKLEATFYRGGVK